MRFATTMLEIEDLSNKDALFYFNDGLKDWARVELDRRDMNNLDDAIAAVESLDGYSFKNKKRNPGKSGENKSGQNKAHDRKDGRNSKPAKRDASKSLKPCFIYEGLHWTRLPQ